MYNPSSSIHHIFFLYTTSLDIRSTQLQDVPLFACRIGVLISPNLMVYLMCVNLLFGVGLRQRRQRRQPNRDRKQIPLELELDQPHKSVWVGASRSLHVYRSNRMSMSCPRLSRCGAKGGGTTSYRRASGHSDVVSLHENYSHSSNAATVNLALHPSRVNDV